ncbi:MAG: 30S ribosomal protein S2 [Patescibacteria group bacterium]|nr:30S ribosomal protein S2 [Patescibacteria group bacterium]
MSTVMEKDTELNNEVQKAPVEHDPAKLALLEEMMKAGLYMGKRHAKTHPRMKPYLFGVRSGVEVIDLEETLKMLDAAMDFVKSKVAAKGVVLMVGSTPVAKDLVEAMAKKLSLPYVTERWLGGTLTNFKTLSKRVAHFKKLKSDKESGRLEKYTKKERLNIDRQITKMTTMFGGIEHMDRLPDVVFVVDVAKQMTAVREAKRVKAPVVGVLNSDTDPESVDYPIAANDRSMASIAWMLARFEKAVLEGRAAVPEAGKVVAKA